jgi:hypothetical protein
MSYQEILKQIESRGVPNGVAQDLIRIFSVYGLASTEPFDCGRVKNELGSSRFRMNERALLDALVELDWVTVINRPVETPIGSLVEDIDVEITPKGCKELKKVFEAYAEGVKGK